MKLQEVTNDVGNFMHYCPGCKMLHSINTKTRNINNAIWSFNGDQNKPTFAPSINIRWEPVKGQAGRCHYFIKDGMIEYCSDSTHELAGKTVELPDLKHHL